MWGTIFLYSLSVDVFVVGNYNSNTTVFPYSVLNKSEIYQNQSNSEESKKENKQSQLFVDFMVGRIHFKRLYFTLMNLVLCVLGCLVSVQFSHLFGGIFSIIFQFAISSILQTKILFWLNNYYLKALYISIKLIEVIFVILLASKLRIFFSQFLKFTIVVASVGLSLLDSITCMSSESQLISAISLIFPIFVVLLSIPAFPLIIRWLDAKESKLRKFELLSIVLVPLFISTLSNWWFHTVWLGYLQFSIISYKNTLIIYCTGLLISIFLLISVNITQLALTKRFPLVALLIISYFSIHVILLNKIFFY